MIHVGDCLAILPTLEAESVQCVVTSPPYFGLRDYGCDGQIGLEASPDEFVDALVAVFREVRRVLREDGVVFLNLGDSYFGGGQGGGGSFAKERRGWRAPAYGTSDRAESGSPGHGSFSRSLCDACRAILRTHTAHSAHQLESTQSPSPCAPNQARTVSVLDHPPTLDSEDPTAQLRSAAATAGLQPSSRLEPLPRSDAQGSTNPEFDPLLPGECCHCSNCGACLSVLRSSTRDARLCARTKGGPEDYRSTSRATHRRKSSAGIASTGDASVRHTSGTASACQNSTGNLKPKDLIGIPWMVAFALRADGWFLRQDIIWHKPNPMPESITDRCTKSHEYLFLLTKSARYFYDAQAIAEPLAPASVARLSQPRLDEQAGSDRVPGKTNGPMKAVARKSATAHAGMPRQSNLDATVSHGDMQYASRNKRSVWTVPTMPFREAHFATFPEALIEPCILAGTRGGDVVLDPFMGAGTTAVVCRRLGRRWVGCELNPEYAAIAERRIAATPEGLALGSVA